MAPPNLADLASSMPSAGVPGFDTGLDILTPSNLSALTQLNQLTGMGGLGGGSVGQAEMTPRQKLAAAVIQMLPLGIAALSGGGAERWAAAGSGGLVGGQAALKDFGEEAKRRAAMEQMNAKLANTLLNTGLKGGITKEVAGAKEDAKANAREDTQAHQIELEGIKADNREDLATNILNLKNRIKDEEGQANRPSPELIQATRSMAQNIYGDRMGKDIAVLPDDTDWANLKQYSQNVLKEGRVAELQGQRQQENRATKSPFGVFNLQNPQGDNSPGSAFFSDKQVPKIQQTIQFGENLTGQLDHLDKLLDPKRTVPAPANEVNQVIQSLIVNLKNLQGMGANFTWSEQGMVQGQLGVAPPPIDAETFTNWFKKTVLLNGNNPEAVANARNEIVRGIVAGLTSNNAGLDPDKISKLPDGKAFVDSMMKTPAGSAQIRAYRQMIQDASAQAAAPGINAGGAAAAPAGKIVTSPDGTRFRIIIDAQGNPVGKVRM